MKRAAKVSAVLLCGATGIGVADFSYAVDSSVLLPNALPTAGQIAAGQGSISYGVGGQANNQLTVTQSSDKLIANWNTFNIGEQASVHFQQPNALSAALNRVAAGNPSQILGNLTANGQVYLINPSGIVFGKNAQVNVGALVASSLNLTNEDFLAGKNNFSNLGNSAAIQNLGNLQGKVVALIAPQTKNDGAITASGVALAAGDTVNLDFTGDGLITVQVDQATLNALAENNGLIKADGGLVILTAQSANALYEAVVNNTGTIQANSLENKNGKIILAGPEKGIVQVTGTLDASGKNVGGEIYVGGGWQGKDPTISQATRTYIGKDAVLNASATEKGDGGIIAVWSDVHNENSMTRAYGAFLANAGEQGGDGGKIETSGHWLDTAGAHGSAAAINGRAGEWLLDPSNVLINNAVTTLINDVTADQTKTWTPLPAGAVLSTSDIQAALNGGTNVKVVTTSGAGDRGDIQITNAIAKTSGVGAVTLTLQAANSIIVDAGISNAGGVGNTGALNVILDADNDNGTVDGNGAIIVNADISTGGGFVTFGDPTYVAGSGARTLSTTGGAASFGGELVIANTAGLTVNTSGGDITFSGPVNSGNSYTKLGSPIGVVWEVAKNGARGATGSGASTGDTYLATITSALENAVALYAAGDDAQVWVGGQRADTNDWVWVTGPEGLENAGAGHPFFTQTGEGAGNVSSGAYANWALGQPAFGDATALSLMSTGKWTNNNLAASRSYIQETNLDLSPLTVNSGAGAISFRAPIGNTKALSALTLTSALRAEIGASVTTRGEQTYNTNLELKSSTTTLTQTAADTHFIWQVGRSLSNTRGNSANLTIITPGDIELGAGSLINSAVGGLDLVLNSDSDAINGGSIWLASGASILTSGGNVTLGGGTALDGSGYAKGFNSASVESNARYNGVTLNGTLNAGGGNVVVRGQGLADLSGLGISVGSAGIVTTDINSTITLTGIGGNTATGVAISGSVFNDSIQRGDINITGTNNLGLDGLDGVNISGQIRNVGDVTLAATGNLFVSGSVTANELQVFTLAAGNDATFISSINNVTTLAANLQGDLSFQNGGALTIGHAGNTDGITSTNGLVEVVTNTGNLTLDKNITTGSASDSAVILNAGKNALSNTTTGINILVNGAPSITTGVGGRATLYTGSITGSTGLTNLIGLGSGHFRYGSDEVSAVFTGALGIGTYAIYREQPTVTVTARNDNKIYNKVAYTGGHGVDYAGFVNGDAADLLSGTLTYSGTSQNAVNVNGGAIYTITPAGLNNSLGYRLSYVDGALTIAPKNLTVAYTASNKVYDGNATTSVTASSADVIEGDVVLFQQAAEFDNKNVGSQKAVNVRNIKVGGVAAGNYSVQNSTADTTADITVKPLTVTIASANKIYDGSTATTAILSDNRVAGDALTFANTTAVFDNKNVGTGKTVTVNGINFSGADAANYSLSNTTATGTADITAKELTLTGFDAANKIYDGTTAATIANVGSLTGVLTNEVVTVSNTGATFANKNIGTGKTVTLAGITLAGADAGNYSIATTATDTANITAKTLTLTGFDAANKIYDGTTTATITNAGSLTGVIDGDTVTVSNSGAIFDNKKAGTEKTVTLNGLTLAGVDKANYVLATTAVDTATITPAVLTATAADDIKKTNGLAYFGGKGVTYTGFVSGEDSSIIKGVLTYGGTSQGAIIPGRYLITPSGTTAENYTLSFIDGQLTILSPDLSATSSNLTSVQAGVTGTAGSSVSADMAQSDFLVGPGSGSVNIIQVDQKLDTALERLPDFLPQQLQPTAVNVERAVENAAPLTVFIVTDDDIIQSVDNFLLMKQSDSLSLNHIDIALSDAQTRWATSSTAQVLNADFILSDGSQAKDAITLDEEGVLAVRIPSAELNKLGQQEVVLRALQAVAEKSSSTPVKSVVIQVKWYVSIPAAKNP